MLQWNSLLVPPRREFVCLAKVSFDEQNHPCRLCQWPPCLDVTSLLQWRSRLKQLGAAPEGCLAFLGYEGLCVFRVTWLTAPLQFQLAPYNLLASAFRLCVNFTNISTTETAAIKCLFPDPASGAGVKYKERAVQLVCQVRIIICVCAWGPGSLISSACSRVDVCVVFVGK